MASSPITSWQIDGETVENVAGSENQKLEKKNNKKKEKQWKQWQILFWGGLQNHFRW